MVVVKKTNTSEWELVGTPIKRATAAKEGTRYKTGGFVPNALYRSYRGKKGKTKLSGLTLFMRTLEAAGTDTRSRGRELIGNAEYEQSLWRCDDDA